MKIAKLKIRNYSARAFHFAFLVCLISSLVIGTSSVRAAEAPVGTVRLVVELKDINGDAAAQRILRDAVREVRRLSTRAPRSYTADGERLAAADLRRWRIIDVAAQDAPAVLEELAQSPAVASVHREEVYHAALLPNDPLFGTQWGLLSTAQPLSDINAPAAWEVTTGSGSTVIAVIDGGVDLAHQDLAGKLWTRAGEIAGNGLDDDGNGFIDDVHGWDFTTNRPAGTAHDHGTHVAGIAAAHSNNGTGVVGVDWGARVMSVRVLNSSGAGREEWIIRGIGYAVDNGADIINLSLVGARSPALAAAIENAYASGVVVVAAAGNSHADTGRSNPYPVCADIGGVNMVLGVGATDEDGEPASFSNYGSCVDVSAPGARIWSTVRSNNYRRMSGTSMSSPFAAGVAGLYLSLHPGASPAEVIAALRAGDSFNGAQGAEWTGQFGGRLNAARVVGAAFDEPVPGPAAGGGPAVTGEPLLTVQKTGPASAAAGGTITYSIVVANAGTAAAVNVLIRDRFDTDLAFVAASSSGACHTEGREIVCTGGNLDTGDSITFTLAFQVAATARCGETFRNRASVYRHDERGRSRRAGDSERVTTRVECSVS